MFFCWIYAGHGTPHLPPPRIRSPDDLELQHIDFLAFEHFKFQELLIGGLVPILLSLFEYWRCHLRVLDPKNL